MSERKTYRLGRITDIVPVQVFEMEECFDLAWCLTSWVANGAQFYVFEDTPKNNDHFMSQGDGACEYKTIPLEDADCWRDRIFGAPGAQYADPTRKISK